MTTKILRNIGLALIFVIPFIPLYVSNSLFFPFITGKGFAFRILVEIIFAIWLLLILRDKRYAPRFSWISVFVTIFMLVVLVADLVGVNPLRSIWSNFERMEGWMTIVHLWAYFMAVTSIFGIDEEGKRMWHYFFNTTIAAALLVSTYGLFQLFGWAAVHQGSTRLDASLGNAAYMAVYMLIHIFISIYMCATQIEKRKVGWAWFYAVVALLFTFILMETSTRGTILGLIGGVMLSTAIYAMFGRGQSKKSRMISGGILIGIILLGVLFYFNRGASFIQKNDTLQRLASISWSDTKTQARGYIWPMAVKGTFENSKTSIIGWGQENFNYIFNKYYAPQMWTQEQWFDRAHSVFLDWLVAGGVVGLLSYLSLFVVALIAIWKSELTFVEKTIFIGLLAAYAVHNIFVFDNLASYILFFTVLGFLHFLRAGDTIRWFTIKDEQTENSIIVRDYIFLPVIIIVSLATLYAVNVRVIQANTRLIAAMTSCSGKSTPTTATYTRALSLNQTTANQEIREQYLACATGVIGSNFPGELKDEFYKVAKQEIDAQIKTVPNDARAYVLGGSFYNSIHDYNSALPVLEKAHELSPEKQTIDFELAATYMNLNKGDEAVGLMKHAYESAPDNGTAQTGYIATLILAGQEAKAKELFGDKPELFLNDRVIAVYAKLKQYQKVIDSYKALIKKEPDNSNYHGSLANAYFLNGQISLSIAELKGLEEKYPASKAQIEDAIKAIQAGKNPF